MSKLRDIPFRHPDDKYSCSGKGAIAQAYFVHAIKKHYKDKKIKVKIEKTTRADDIKGIDYVVSTEFGKKTSFAVTSNWQATGKKYIKVTVGCMYTDRIPHLFNSSADVFAFYNVDYGYKFILIEPNSLREYIEYKYHDVLHKKIMAQNQAEAIREGIMYRRYRKSKGIADLFLFLKIDDIKSNVKIKEIDIPPEAFVGVVVEEVNSTE